MAKILCIDDDQDILNSLAATLESNGHAVVTANTGAEGVEKAKKEKADLIIVDVMMERDTAGFHVSYEVRRDDNIKFTPLLMLTSVNQKTGFKFNPDFDGEFLPVDSFIEKPFVPKDLIALVNKLLSMPKDKINVEGKTKVMD
jgi:DNA-binding response OmpR family regulator